MSNSNWRTQKPIAATKNSNNPRGGRSVGGPARGRRQMQYIASVSRSSGLEKDGDALKDYSVQEEYREFIQAKVEDLWKDYTQAEDGVDSRKRLDAQENILILFRKLREGISSSRRTDVFALEVYETSLYLAALFDSSKQMSSIIPHLIPDMYISNPTSSSNRLLTTLISLLHHLVSYYPSQGTFHQHLHSLPSFFLPKKSPELVWLSTLCRSLRCHNYTKFEELTRSSSFSHFVPISISPSPPPPDSSPPPPHPHTNEHTNRDIGRKALFNLVNRLRRKCREATWTIIRGAYRELTLTPHLDANVPSGTRAWLCRSLALSPVSETKTDDGSNASVDVDLVDDWMEMKRKEEHVRPREGMEGKWIVCKIR